MKNGNFSLRVKILMPPFDLCTGPLGSIECWQKIGAVTQNSVFNIKFNILTQNSAPQQGQNFDGGGATWPLLANLHNSWKHY